MRKSEGSVKKIRFERGQSFLLTGAQPSLYWDVAKGTINCGSEICIRTKEKKERLSPNKFNENNKTWCAFGAPEVPLDLPLFMQPYAPSQGARVTEKNPLFKFYIKES